MIHKMHSYCNTKHQQHNHLICQHKIILSCLTLVFFHYFVGSNIKEQISFHGSKKFPEKLYASAVCTPEKSIPNFTPSNENAVRTPSTTRIDLTLYLIFPANTFPSKTILHGYITVLLMRIRSFEDSLIIIVTKLLTNPLGTTTLK